MKKVVINGVTYEVIRNDQECLDTSILEEKITDYFDPYDYIFGDYAYEKVRLKGFYESSNKSANKINDIKNLDDYIKDYCSYGCKLFLLKKVR
ncbi:MAG: YutD family protein [Bacilli bacterium]|nr:YutD family protein [Bacilli bacterium]